MSPDISSPTGDPVADPIYSKLIASNVKPAIALMMAKAAAKKKKAAAGSN
jgi:hypothetical protein